MPKSRSSKRVAQLEAELAALHQYASNLEVDIERRIDNEATMRRMAAGREVVLAGSELCVCRPADGEHRPACPAADDTPDVPPHERWPQYRSGYPSRVVPAATR